MNQYLWPESRCFAALEALALDSRLIEKTVERRAIETSVDSLPIAASMIGVEAQPVEIPYRDFERWVTRGPALARSSSGLLAITARGAVLAPDGTKHRIPAATIRAALCSDLESPFIADIDSLLRQAKIPAAKQARARESILRERLNSARVRGLWVLRLPPGADFRKQMRHAGIQPRLIALAAAHALQYVLWIVAWWIAGRSVLSGRVDPGWMFRWGLLLLALVPLRVAITWLQGKIAIGTGALLKRRLFLGALRLDPDSIRHQGAGQLLGSVIESEAVEALALSGGFLGLVAVIELAAGTVVLGAGAAGPLHALLLLAWIGIAALIGVHYFRRNRTWTDVRLDITHELVENMVGHRTRIAQLPADRWHDGEDEALRRYTAASKPMDHFTTALLAIVPRGWLVLGLAALIPVYQHASTASVAVALGGILLAYRALKRLAAGAWQLAGAAVAWERVSILYRAAAVPENPGSLHAPVEENSKGVVAAQDLSFRFGERAEPVLSKCSLQISAGDRLVLEGPSGGGKSTLVSLLAGLRQPDSGRLVLHGLDHKTLGAERWIQRIAAAPQFHENHVLAETFAFNALMARHGIPTPANLEEAEIICRELGLGDLLDRMPAGMLQMVGETGWQLSHGERSRLYIARALLQDSEVVILDESFAALDPENLRRSVECVVRRARSLLVVAHR